MQTQVRIAAIQQGPRAEDPKWNLEELLKSIDEAACGGVDYVATIDLAEVARVRQRLPLLSERRGELYLQ